MVANNINRQFITSLIAASSFVLSFQSLSAQQDSAFNKKKFRKYTYSFAAGYSASVVGMYYLWYKDSPRQPFQFFNDNAEWKQVDKFGHAFSSFYLSRATHRALKNCNMTETRARMTAAITGFAIMLPIEVFDGFSADYGASAGDLLANSIGPLFFLGQQSLWNEIRIHPKFSFHYSDYSALRPSLLGDNKVNQIVKDYNGQTYWLSADMDKFLKFPKWLNLSAGYGAHAMVYARDESNNAAGYNAYRQFYLALDIDLTAIRTKSKFVKTLISVANSVKIPAPTIEFSRKSAHFHLLYF